MSITKNLRYRSWWAPASGIHFLSNLAWSLWEGFNDGCHIFCLAPRCIDPCHSEHQKPILLLVDGHASHTSLAETSLLCKEDDIVLYCFLAHASHTIQPLDQAFSWQYQACLVDPKKQYLANHGEVVNLKPFAAALRPVWDKCCTREMAAKSFWTAVIVPFNPSTVLASGKFGPSCVYRTTQTNPTHTAPTGEEQQSCTNTGITSAT